VHRALSVQEILTPVRLTFRHMAFIGLPLSRPVQSVLTPPSQLRTELAPAKAENRVCCSPAAYMVSAPTAGAVVAPALISLLANRRRPGRPSLSQRLRCLSNAIAQYGSPFAQELGRNLMNKGADKAIQKVCSFFEAWQETGSTDIVLLRFYKEGATVPDDDEQAIWKPSAQLLHEKFHHLGKDVYDFTLKYTCNGKIRRLDPTKVDIETFLESSGEKEIRVYYQSFRAKQNTTSDKVHQGVHVGTSAGSGALMGAQVAGPAGACVGAITGAIFGMLS